MNETPNRILVVDDEPSITEFVSYALKKEGFYTDVVDNGEDALALATKNSYDLFVLDIMLPGMDGYELCRRLRSKTTAPVLFLSARDTELDKVVGLEIGGDDYLAKPFDLDELHARVAVQLRHAARGAGRAAGVLRFKDWTLDPEARTLAAAGEPVKLTRLEFGIVEALVRRPKKVFTKRELFEAAWHEECFVEDKAVNVHVSNIRGKLRASGTDAYIETVWGIGFKLAE